MTSQIHLMGSSQKQAQYCTLSVRRINWSVILSATYKMFEVSTYIIKDLGADSFISNDLNKATF